MGVIRGRHVSPGIYTNMTAIRKPSAATKTAPKSTLYINVGGGDGGSDIYIYYGYTHLETKDGQMTQSELNRLMSLSGDEIRRMTNVAHDKTKEKTYTLNNGEEIVIKSELSEDELIELIDSGEYFEDISDSKNNLVVMLIPIANFNNSNFDIIDLTFNKSVKDLFSKLNEVIINGNKYAFLAMFNDNWAYSSAGEDKVIAPLKLVLK